MMRYPLLFLILVCMVHGIMGCAQDSPDVPPLYLGELVFEEVPGYPECHASFIIELPNGDLYTAWYAGSREGADDVAILASRKTPEAGAWSDPEIIADIKGHSEGNPVLFAYPSGTLGMWYPVKMGEGWESCTIHYQESKDNGETWEPSSIFREEWGWFVRNHIILLSDGSCLFPIYDEINWASVYLSSNDRGKTWTKLSEIRTSPGNIQPTVIERGDGSLYSLMRTGGSTPDTRWLRHSESADRGKTWKEAEFSSLRNPNAAAEMVRLSSGNVVLAFNNSQEKRTPLTLALSLDEGRTWPYMRNLETEAGEFSYPSIIEAGKGSIHATYTFKRENIKHIAVNEAWIMAGEKAEGSTN